MSEKIKRINRELKFKGKSSMTDLLEQKPFL